ncbi:hypothetical protein NPIL_80951, partial [Nephila pilipes]
MDLFTGVDISTFVNIHRNAPEIKQKSKRWVAFGEFSLKKAMGDDLMNRKSYDEECLRWKVSNFDD